MNINIRRHAASAFAAFGLLTSAPAFAAEIHGQVVGAGAPLVDATVTLWAAGAGAPTQLARSQTDADGGFSLDAGTNGAELYVVAQGGRAASKASSDKR